MLRKQRFGFPFSCFVALACPNTLQILARYKPALGANPQSTKFRLEGRIVASLSWAIAVSVIAEMAIVSLRGPSEFLYWQFLGLRPD